MKTFKPVIALAAICLPAQLALSASASTPPSAAEMDDMTLQVIALTNTERFKFGLPSLKPQRFLTASAKWMAHDMAEKNYFDHNDSRKRSIDPRLPDFGYKDYQTIGENIAAGQKTAASVVNGWMHSPHHRENILNPDFKEIGVGVFFTQSGKYHWYWVQDFGKKFAD